jgi:hypothetical protein
MSTSEFVNVTVVHTHEGGSLSPRHGASSMLRMEERPPIERVAVSKLNKQPRTAE